MKKVESNGEHILKFKVNIEDEEIIFDLEWLSKHSRNTSKPKNLSEEESMKYERERKDYLNIVKWLENGGCPELINRIPILDKREKLYESVSKKVKTNGKFGCADCCEYLDTCETYTPVCRLFNKFLNREDGFKSRYEECIETFSKEDGNG